MDAVVISLVIFFVVLPLLVVLGLYGAKRKSPKARGKRGEASVAYMLENLQKQYGGFIINDVFVPAGKGATQIDHIYFSNKGIFVIETKNISGYIFGNEQDEQWTQVLGRGNIKHSLYNPIKQNMSHVYAISKLLWPGIPVISVVIFAQGNIEHINSDRVYTLYSARRMISRFSPNLTDKRVKEAYDRIVAYKNNPIITEEEHVKNVQSRH